MLYNELLSIFQQNKYLRETFDFEVSYKRLKEYIRVEVQQRNDYLSPFRYSKMYQINLEDSINFFLSISSPSNDDFIKIIYKYKCEECGAINFFTSKDVLNDSLECTNCGEEVYGLHMDTDRFVLVFELSESLKDEFRCLKVETLSKDDVDIGRGVSLTTASQIITENPAINPEFNQTIKRYWDIANGQN